VVGIPREGKGEKEGREKPPGRGRAAVRLPPRTPSLTHARVAAAASSPEPAPTPALPRRPGVGEEKGRGLPGHIRLTIGEGNYRAYGNHGLGLLLLNSELSPAASLLCPAPPQRRTDRRRRPHCAGAQARGILGAVVTAAPTGARRISSERATRESDVVSLFALLLLVPLAFASA
jgi:hypothetical protein